MKLVIDLEYFPPISSIKNSYPFSHIIFEQYEIYPKASFRNRMIIANANGKVTLSIPILGGRNQRKCYKDIKMDNRVNWRNNHFRNLESAYNRSPWFSFYRDELAFLFNRPVVFLIDWNLLCYEWLKVQIGRKDMHWSLTEEYLKYYDSVAFVDSRQQLSPSNYEELRAPRYHQVFEEKLGFLPNLSILDLLFCEGPGAIRLLGGT